MAQSVDTNTLYFQHASSPGMGCLVCTLQLEKNLLYLGLRQEEKRRGWKKDGQWG
jgi:3'-phosphoadenosine 5'-phosphosulfate sulfotransferase (PAPS reductase)/FAD synthetase